MENMPKSVWVCMALALVLVCAIWNVPPQRAAHSGLQGGLSAESLAENTADSAIGDAAASVAQSAPPLKKLHVTVASSQNNEPVFSLAIADFVESFDGFYWDDHKALYFPSTSRWVSYARESAPHSQYGAEYYRFQRDPNATSQPFLSVYLPTGESCIQTITLDFDDHGYTDQKHAEYKMVCFYTLKVLFPDSDEARLKDLVETLDKLARSGLCATPYGPGVTPSTLYYKDGIGLYPYFCVGESSRICIAPVTEEYLQQLAASGVALHVIDAQADEAP